MKSLSWILAAAAAAFACHFAVRYDTPVDAALPFLAVGVTLLAAVSYSEIMLAVPLFVVAEIAIPGEDLRLLVIGLIWSAAAVVVLSGAPDSQSGVAGLRARLSREIVVAILAIFSLRWIPFPAWIGREIFLLAICIAIVFVLGRTPFAVAIAVITALITPAIPLRTLAIPLIVLVVAIAARSFGMPRFSLTWPSSIAIAFVLLFFAWSGIVARAFPYFLRAAKPQAQRSPGVDALPANASATLEVPRGATQLVVSGANVAHLRRGAPLGRIEPGGRIIRIGDASDWGYTRRAEFFGANNPLPKDAAGKIRGYGYDAWLDGAGRVSLPRGAKTIRVTADASLGAGQSLQVEGFE